MKKILAIILSFLFLSAPIYSQSQCVDCTNSQNPGTYSSVIGYNCYASGSYSTAIGFNAQSLSSKSLSFGTYTKASGDRSIVIGSGVPNANIYLENSDGPSFMVGFNSRYPTFFVSEPYVIGGNFTETGRVGIGNVTEPEAKLHLQADAEETAAIFIEPNNWLTEESANLLLGTTSLGISSDRNKGFVFKSAKDYLFKDGKMGIGAFYANAPEAMLHIKSSNSFEEASLFIEPFRDDLEGGGIGDEKAWSGNLYLGTKTNIISGVSGTGLLYTTSRYHAFQGGNVGIGTTEPLGMLHVTDGRGAVIYDNGSLAVAGKLLNPTLSLLQDGGSMWNIIHGGGGNMHFCYNSTNLSESQAAITSEHGLFVNSGITVSDMQYYTEPKANIYVVQDGTYNEVAAEYETKLGGRIFFVPKLNGSAFNQMTMQNDVGIFWSNTTNQSTEGGRFLIAPHNSSTELSSFMAMLHNGNVGIGIHEPKARLDVKSSMQISGWTEGYSFAVESITDDIVFAISPSGETKIASKLWAQEVEVVADVWSDFVFSESYNLKPLKEVEDFITANKHLPDVPSEQEIKEDGLNLGEMDAILLQKIEELTLYIIEQDKKIDELNGRIEELSNDK
jgi:hypothetical protein